MKKETYSYKGWLISDDIVKRAFGVMGHYLLAYLILIACGMIVALIFMIFGGILSAFVN